MTQDGSGSQIVFEEDGMRLAVHLPEAWEYFETEYGVVLAEETSTVESRGHVSGLLVSVFLHPLNDITIPIGSVTNMALVAMEQIVANPEYVGNVATTHPVSLSWSDIPAAYYLTNDRDKTLTVVFGITVPDEQRLVFCHISAPKNKAHLIRSAAPVLLNGLTINDTLILDGHALDAALPEQFIFPIYTPSR